LAAEENMANAIATFEGLYEPGWTIQISKHLWRKRIAWQDATDAQLATAEAVILGIKTLNNS
jgi:hypothetical protein